MKLILLALLLFSCSVSKKVEEVTSVSIDQELNGSIQIREVDTPANTEDKVDKKKPIISLTLYSSAYHSLALVELLKALEKSQIEIDLFSSQGFGSVIVALFARDNSLSKVEWSLFKLLKELKSEQPYSGNWMKKILFFVENQFEDLKFEDLKSKLYFPVLGNEGRVEFITKGKVKDALIKTLNLNRKENFLRAPSVYHFGLNRFEVNINKAISFIPTAPKVTNMVSFEYGIMTNFLGLILTNKEDIHVFSPDSDKPLDKMLPLSEITDLYQSQIADYITKLKEQVENWQEEGSTGFHY